MLCFWLAVPTEHSTVLWASDLAQLHQPHALLNSQLAERAVVGRQAQRQRQEAEQAAARQAALERQGAPDEDATPRYEEVVLPPADRGPPPQEARAHAGVVLATPVQAPPVQASPQLLEQVVEHSGDQPVVAASPLLRENPMERAVRNAIRDAAHRTLVNGSSTHPMAWIPPPRGFEAGVTAGVNAGFAEAKRQAMAHRITSPISQQCTPRASNPLTHPWSRGYRRARCVPGAGK